MHMMRIHRCLIALGAASLMATSPVLLADKENRIGDLYEPHKQALNVEKGSERVAGEEPSFKKHKKHKKPRMSPHRDHDNDNDDDGGGDHDHQGEE